MTLVELSQILPLICSLLFLLKLANIASIDCRSLLYLNKDFICIQGTSALIRKKPATTPQFFSCLQYACCNRLKLITVKSGVKYSSKIELFCISFFSFEQWEGLFSLATCFKGTVPFAMLLQNLDFNRNYSQGNLNETQNF